MADTPYVRMPKEVEPRVYELGFLLSPLLADEQKEGALNAVKELFTSKGGEIITEGTPEFIDLAYQIPKIIDNKRNWFEQGYFGWFKVVIAPNQIALVKEELDRMISVLRYLLIAAIRENTIISKKPLGKILRKSKRGDGLTADESDVVEEAPVSEEVEAPAEKEEVVADVATEEETKEVTE